MFILILGSVGYLPSHAQLYTLTANSQYPSLLRPQTITTLYMLVLQRLVFGLSSHSTPLYFCNSQFPASLDVHAKSVLLLYVSVSSRLQIISSQSEYMQIYEFMFTYMRNSLHLTLPNLALFNLFPTVLRRFSLNIFSHGICLSTLNSSQ